MSAINLRDYQLEAIETMRNGCILCGGVGSGKSRTSLGYYYKKNGGNLYSKSTSLMRCPKDLYIITTARKRDTGEWEEELHHFLMSTDSEMNLYGNKIIIDSWNNIQKYKNVIDSFFIFDEQRVVGSGAWVKAFLNITRKNQWILLSATPGDTWQDYIPVFIANGFYKNKTEFKREHCVYSPYTKYPKIDRYVGAKKLERLRNQILIDMNFDRPTISHHIDIFCPYDLDIYKSTNKNKWNIFKEEPCANAADLCYVLRKIVNSDYSRKEVIKNLLDKHERLIIFYNFTYELEILKSIDWGKKVSIAEWNGQKHQPLPETKKWIFLVQYAAGAEGWNCIKTDCIVFYSPSYSYKMMQQAAGRIDRLNTPYKNLYYYHIKSKAPIDIAIDRALKNKKTFNEKAFIKW